MNRSVLVLAVPHELQGSKFLGYVQDPAYSKLVESLIKDGVDFVFEEAAGRGPSIAENLAKALLGPHHYLDIDPPRDERQEYGIAADTGETTPIDPYRRNDPGVPADAYRREIVEEHRNREELWLKRLEAQQFGKGLAICGLVHGLSFAFRLQSVGISDSNACSYLPYHKLCTRQHGS